MQLFICSDFEEQGSELIIKNNGDLIQQLRKVLRAKPWYVFYVQDFQWEQRIKLELIKYTESEIYTKILERKKNLNEKVMIGMLIAFPNKQEKLELIVQKLTEIGISHIYFRKAENSQIKELNENKIKRMRKIMKEALEQSRWWEFPQIEIVRDLNPLWKIWNFCVFDIEKKEKSDIIKQVSLPPLWVIWPEGGLSQKDYQRFPINYKVHSLWDTVLRMETAAIIGAWYLKRGI